MTKYIPSAIFRDIFFRVTPRDVPYGSGDLVANDIAAFLGGLATNDLVPSVLLNEADGSRHQPGGNEIEDGGGEDKEPAEADEGTASIDDEADDASA